MKWVLNGCPAAEMGSLLGAGLHVLFLPYLGAAGVTAGGVSLEETGLKFHVFARRG